MNLGYCTIKAPVSGVIGEIPVRTGDQVSPATNLTILSGNTVMNAEFSVTEAIVESQVTEGYTKEDKEKVMASLPPVTFIMKNGTEYPHKGRITSLTGVVDQVLRPHELQHDREAWHAAIHGAAKSRTRLSD